MVDPVGELEDLVHVVGDVDHAPAVLLELEEKAVDRLHLPGGELAGDLVEDQELRVDGQRLGDLHHELFRLRQVLEARVRVDIDVEGLEEPHRGALHAFSCPEIPCRT